MIAALLAAMPILVLAQRPICTISPPSRQCQIADNQVCPGGCVRPANCPRVITVTSTLTTTTRARTTLTSTTTITNTTTTTITPTLSASIITVTASRVSTAPPACRTEVPYANLYTFPDGKCTNTTNLQLGPGNPTTINGLVGSPFKFSNLTYNATSKYNESSCVILPGTEGGARSMYFTIDGTPRDQGISCTLNMYIDSHCQGDGNESPARYTDGNANACQVARLQGNATDLAANGPWRSAVFKCAYSRDLCTDSQIALGTCTGF
jgi:hypothetical protein